MKQTENLNLPILEDGDAYLKDVQNQAFIRIDLEFKGLVDKIIELERKVRILEGDM